MHNENDTTPTSSGAVPPRGTDPISQPAQDLTAPGQIGYVADTFGSPTPSEFEPATTPVPTSMIDSANRLENQTITHASSPSSFEVSPDSVAPPTKTSKNKWMITAIVAGAMVLLSGTGAAAYNLWYQNPDKVIGDAMVNALRAKSIAYTGSLDVKDKSGSLLGNLKVTLEGKNTRSDSELNVRIALDYGGKDYEISGAGVVDGDGNIYVKVNDTKKLVDSFTDGMELPSSFTSIITKIDSKWIKISADDLKDVSEEYSKTQKCTSDVIRKYENDSAAINQVVDLYSENRFIEVKEKLGSKNGSLGYVIDGDEEKAKSFAGGLSETTIMKAMVACDSNFKLDSDDQMRGTISESKSTTRVEVWVDRWSHRLTKVSMSDASESSDINLVFEPTFGDDVRVDIPKDFITLSQLQADIEKAQEEYLQAMGLGMSADPSASMDFSSEL